jgi:hypothetical protein
MDLETELLRLVRDESLEGEEAVEWSPAPFGRPRVTESTEEEPN